jgi:hypothetical protein
LFDEMELDTIGLTGAERVRQVLRPVSDKNVNFLDAELPEKPEVMTDQRLIGQRQERLRVILAKRTHAGTPPTREDRSDVLAQ